MIRDLSEPIAASNYACNISGAWGTADHKITAETAVCKEREREKKGKIQDLNGYDERRTLQAIAM